MSSVIKKTHYTVREAAEELDVTMQRVRQLIYSGQLKAEAVSSRMYMIPKKSFEKLAAQDRPTGVHIDKRAAN